MKEVIWKDIPGYEGYYEASTEGEIRSVDRYVNNRNSFVASRIMHLNMGPSGYLQVSLSKDGKAKVYKVHRIIAETYIPNPEKKPCIDHINTLRTDNRVCNLRWVTLKENSSNPISKHHLKHGKKKVLGERKKTNKRFKEDAPNKPKPVYRYSLSGEFVDSFKSMIEAESVTQIEMTGIRKALNKQYRTAGGYLWKTEQMLFCEPYQRRRHTKCKTIQMTDHKGVLVKEWEAVADASNELNITKCRILRHMKDNKPIEGFYFRYK